MLAWTTVNQTLADTVEEPRPVYAVIYGCIMALGLPLNVVSLWILLRRHGLKSTSTVLMVNLAVSDLFLAISLPTRVHYYATGTWLLGSTACTCVTIFFRNNIRSGTIFITMISADRLLAVVYPLRTRHLRTSLNAWRATAVVWLCVVTLSIPDAVMLSIDLNRLNKSTCFEKVHHLRIHPMAYFQAALMLFLLTVNIVCTALVIWTLRRCLNESPKITKTMDVMWVLVMNLFVFIICFVPVSVSFFLASRSMVMPLICLATANCCLDPVLYYFSLDAFWKKKEAATPAR